MGDSSTKWTVGQMAYRLDEELFDGSRILQAKRASLKFDKGVTEARLKKAVAEFDGNIEARMTQNLIEVRGHGAQTLQECREILDELLTTLDRIVSGHETGISQRDSNVASARARKSRRRSGFRNDPVIARNRH